MPLNEPETTTCGVESLDHCRNQATQIPGAIGSVGTDGVIMHRVSQTDRYALYRSSLLNPLVVINQILKDGETPPSLPSGPVYIQSEGLCRPFAYADLQIKGFTPPVQSANFTYSQIRGQGMKKFSFATLTEIEEDKNHPGQFVFISPPREEPRYIFSASIFGALGKIDATLTVHRGTKPYPLEHPDLYFQYGELQRCICLADGNTATPRLRMIPYDYVYPGGSVVPLQLAVIEGVQQGDQIVISEKKWHRYNDSLVVVKGFTWNDLKRLKQNGGSLTFAPGYQDVLPSIRQNIINTIEFALKPPTPDIPLFSISTAFMGELNNAQVSSNLRQVFDQNGYGLSSNVVIQVICFGRLFLCFLMHCELFHFLPFQICLN